MKGSKEWNQNLSFLICAVMMRILCAYLLLGEKKGEKQIRCKVKESLVLSPPHSFTTVSLCLYTHKNVVDYEITS